MCLLRSGTGSTIRKILVGLVGLMLFAVWGDVANAYGPESSPYYEESADHRAWTINEPSCSQVVVKSQYEKALANLECWRPVGYSVETGRMSAIGEPTESEHYYVYARRGVIPIGKWVVAHSKSSCIHPWEIGWLGTQFHGIPMQGARCGYSYWSGWFPYCADCGEVMVEGYMYLSESSVSSIDEMSLEKDYYYRCPRAECRGLETAFIMKDHTCKGISANRYRVVYEKNSPEVKGNLPDSYHMVDNIGEYNGTAIVPQTTLSRVRNRVGRTDSIYWKGHSFLGWALSPDGEVVYEDGAEIKNLTTKQYDPEKNGLNSAIGTVHLYAVWGASSSSLEINAGEGTYEGLPRYNVSLGCGQEIWLEESKVGCPKGARVSFHTFGGDTVPDIVSEKSFGGFVKQDPFAGILIEEDNRVLYRADVRDKTEDKLTIIYNEGKIILPSAQKTNMLFAGWYRDKNCTILAGMAGEEYTPLENETLYAKWTSLLLTAIPNLTAGDKRGAVDLRWNGADTEHLLYQVYESKTGNAADFVQVLEQKSGTAAIAYNQLLQSPGKHTVVLPYSGFYDVKAWGAAGGSFHDEMGNKIMSGGKGGYVSGKFFLPANQSLIAVVGQQGKDGYRRTTGVGLAGTGGISYGGNGGSNGAGGGSLSGIFVGLEPLAIAGGGGGGGVSLSGNAGGTLGTFGSLYGENQTGAGGGGGGGGYKAGKAGIYKVVYHDHAYYGCQKHTHTGACYHSHTQECYRSYSAKTYSGPRVEEACGCAYQDWRWKCEYPGCGAVWETQTGSSLFCTKGHRRGDVGSSVCPKNASHDHVLVCNKGLICPKSEGYQCGLSTNTVDPERSMATVAEGGSNYVANAAVSRETKNGLQQGNGKIEIVLSSMPFEEKNFMDSVPSPDLASPNAISEQTVKLAKENGMLVISFKQPKDNGTTYYHLVKAYGRSNGTYVMQSNMTETVITTGVHHYEYVIDTRPHTTITEGMQRQNTTVEQIQIPIPQASQYLHIVCVDGAGNRSMTTHIALASAENIIGLETKAIQIESDAGKVAYDAALNKYYVAADGVSAFSLGFQATVEYGQQRLPDVYEYRLMSGDREAIEQLERGMDGSLTRTMFGSMLLQPVGIYNEKPVEKGAVLTESFTALSMLHGQQIYVYPHIALWDQETYAQSNVERDKSHGIWLEMDGYAPVIHQIEQLINWTKLEQNAQDLDIVLKAVDEGSGLDTFIVEIRDENQIPWKQFPVSEGECHISLSQEKRSDLGAFSFYILATDRVGNVFEKEISVINYDMNATLERVLPPGGTDFAQGEGGVVTIAVTGEVNQVELVFPQELTTLDETLHAIVPIEEGLGERAEQFFFHIPLDCPEGDYELLIYSYKDDVLLSEEPVHCPFRVFGSILDKLRTRLR